ncbi:dienelactone hydrolase family protein [Mobilicoccus pelagius]|uniref:Dienelactone hydrolase domain-containing protein n=1 Tax=Mobilicoccus pelagius NBRC 104925 TaxID=1089455 RepID=H5URT8_9MICO|nr:dienelactone hydrolase family protein [Mobilicoccus pelagius]GAB48446.1 hypothetical protein MOPEL_073_00860 [Mobilicoccus pelagius NBRC 104925]
MSADLVILHSAYGQTRGVRAVAEALAATGRRVHVPDFYRGRVFTTEAQGIAHRDAIGYQALLDRVRGDIAGLDPTTSFLGFSLGASFAHRLAAERPAMGHLVLVGNTNPVSGSWPGIPVQVHRFEEDHWVRPSDVADLREAVEVSGGMFEDHVLPGHGHLFTEPHLPEYDPARVDTFVAQVHEFLDWA